MILKKINGYTPFAYQADAIDQSIANCVNNGGCMINHVTGTGKTLIRQNRQQHFVLRIFLNPFLASAEFYNILKLINYDKF
jgi:hypothetical protein